MHINAEVVTRSVHHPAAVELLVWLQRFLGGHWQQAPLGSLGCNYLHRGRVNLAELNARLRHGEGCVCGLTHGLINLALHIAELAVNRNRASHIRGVKTVDLDARIEQQKVAFANRAVVDDPVQGAGV